MVCVRYIVCENHGCILGVYKRSKNRLYYDMPQTLFLAIREYALVEIDDEAFQSEVLAFYRIYVR